VPAAAAVPVPVVPVADPEARTSTSTGIPTGAWPCTACSQANDLALAVCAGCGTPFLAAARHAPPSIVLPVVGDLLALSPVRRVGLAVAAVLAFVVVSALLALLLA
jgi:hypothetical protein